MMKRIVPFLLGFMVCSTLSLADYSDGFITAGEYEYGVEWNSYDPPLIVEGGGADVIEMRNFGRLEVRYTSIPINGNWYTGGILDILLDGNSELLYLGGETEEITIYDDALATLKGGRIDYITSFQYTATKHVNIYSQPGWSWLEADKDLDGELEIVGIMGLWQDSTAFNINFVDRTEFGYDPTWMNINVVPEPATLPLICFGAALIRKR